MKIEIDLTAFDDLILSEVKDALSYALRDAVREWAREKANDLAAVTYRDLVADSKWVKEMRKRASDAAVQVIISSAQGKYLEDLANKLDMNDDQRSALYAALSVGQSR